MVFLSESCFSAPSIVNGGAAHTIAKCGADVGNALTSAINTTGGTLIVGIATSYLANPTVTDGGINPTFNYLTQYANIGSVKMWYLEGFNTNSAHQFQTVSGAYAALGVIAFDGTLTTSAIRDSNGGTATAATINTGSAGLSGDICMAGVSGNFLVATSIDNGFTLLDTQTNTTPGANVSLSTAYKVVTAATNPQFTMSGSDTIAADIGCFQASAAVTVARRRIGVGPYRM